MPKITKAKLSRTINWQGFFVLLAAVLLAIIWLAASIISLWFSLPPVSKMSRQTDLVSLINTDQPLNQIKESVYFTIPADQQNFDPLSFTASPDGMQVAYVLKKAGQTSVVLNGQAGPLYDAVTFMIFSPDGQRFAYGVKTKGQEKIIIDGLVGEAYDWTFAPRSFTPDSRYFIYKARSSQGDQMVINNTWTSQAYERIYEPVLTSDRSQLVYYGLMNNKIWRTTIDLNKTTE